jgi:CO/xanthine dehydrogenase FAD-binding subunit
MLALDAVLTLEPGGQQIGLGDLLPLRAERLRQRLITQVSLSSNVKVGYEYVARSPSDRPIVCAAVAVWPSERTRVALGGYGTGPALVFDGTEAQGVETAARSAYTQAGDEWASAEYRQEMAGILAVRALQSVLRGKEE